MNSFRVFAGVLLSLLDLGRFHVSLASAMSMAPLIKAAMPTPDRRRDLDVHAGRNLFVFLAQALSGG